MLSCLSLSHNRPRWLSISTTKFELIINIFNNIYTMIVSLVFRTSCHEYLSRFLSSPKFVGRPQHRHTYIYIRICIIYLHKWEPLSKICPSKLFSNLFFKIHKDFHKICLNLLKGMWYLGLITIWAITFQPLFVHNNKSFSLKLWETVKIIKTDIKLLLFFRKIKKNF